MEKYKINPDNKNLVERVKQLEAELDARNLEIQRLNSDFEKKAIHRSEQLHQSEKIFRSIVLNIPKSLVIVMDREHKFIMVEGDIIERLGYKKQNYEGKHPFEILAKKQYDTTKPFYDRVFRGEQFSLQKNFPLGDFIIHFVPIKDENDFTETAMVIALDISDIKKAQREIEGITKNLEKKIEARTAELTAVNKELEAFTYSVSHDLRAPLRAIDGFARILENEYHAAFDDEAKRLLSVIQYNSKKMAELIDNLLEFSRLGKKNVNSVQINMKELAESVLSDLNKSVEHRAEIKINNLHAVNGDYSLLHQVFFNLISNGIKYSSKNEKPVIEINSATQNGEIIYSVKDNGVGFDMKYSDKLFEIFQRLHSVREFEGTGVGLAIVQRVIKKHNGKVWAEAEPGKGATFYFSLPSAPH